jgi:hypothetical protein
MLDERAQRERLEERETADDYDCAAKFAAMRRASSRVSKLAAEHRPGS